MFVWLVHQGELVGTKHAGKARKIVRALDSCGIKQLGYKVFIHPLLGSYEQLFLIGEAFSDAAAVLHDMPLDLFR